MECFRNGFARSNQFLNATCLTPQAVHLQVDIMPVQAMSADHAYVTDMTCPIPSTDPGLNFCSDVGNQKMSNRLAVVPLALPWRLMDPHLDALSSKLQLLLHNCNFRSSLLRCRFAALMAGHL